MTEVRRRKSEVSNQMAEMNRRVAKFAERLLGAIRASVLKPTSDLRLLISGLCAMLFAFSSSADAQQLTKVPRVGFLAPGSLSLLGFDELQRGLREIGYVEGRNIAIELRSAEGKHGLLAALATELVRLADRCSGDSTQTAGESG